jgi:hypothetical protein
MTSNFVQQLLIAMFIYASVECVIYSQREISPISNDLLSIDRTTGMADEGFYYPSLGLNPNIPAEEKMSLNTPLRILLQDDGVEYPAEIGNVTIGEVLISLEHDAIDNAG